MLFNIVSSSEVRPGDHLYRYGWFEIQQGIAVRCPKLLSIFVITSYKDTLKLVPLNEFKGRSCLRRVVYKQNNSCIKKNKYVLSQPPDEIVRNAFLLLDWIKTSPDRLRTVFANDLSQFAQKCCTTVHEQWHNLVCSIPEQTWTQNKQISRRSRAFNAALMCGMPFRQASQIGKEEFWNDTCNETRSLLTEKDLKNQLSSNNTSNETMIFSPA